MSTDSQERKSPRLLGQVRELLRISPLIRSHQVMTSARSRSFWAMQM